ncbi:hypothetical protein [Altererythrobacter sp. GH1-8]|uniref:hypothetical protein n=1 Tax=Altererythrobacter sp. GH1-8 TaxID=3349333 RepID=UPI00374CBEE8
MSDNGHYAEALVTTAFTVEKTLRRTLRQLIVSAGFRSIDAESIVKGLGGLDRIKNTWEFYDPQNRKLTTVIGAEDWSTFKQTSIMRNKLVHGECVYGVGSCANQLSKTLEALYRTRNCLEDVYGFSGWQKLKVRKKSRLHAHPLVKV